MSPEISVWLWSSKRRPWPAPVTTVAHRATALTSPARVVPDLSRRNTAATCARDETWCDWDDW